MNPRLFDRTLQEDSSKARITLYMNFVGGSVFKYIYDYPYRNYDDIYNSLQKDYCWHTTFNTMEIQFSGMIENRSHEEKFYNFETFLSFLRKNNLLKLEFFKKLV